MRLGESLMKRDVGATCDETVSSMEHDLEALLAHYDFPKTHWHALRTTNPIERINKECKRRTKSMEQKSNGKIERRHNTIKSEAI
jgi:transposase-like protein